jgi:hypothetical protein
LMTGPHLRTGGAMLLMILGHVMATCCAVSSSAEVCAEVALAALVVACGGAAGHAGRQSRAHTLSGPGGPGGHPCALRSDRPKPVGINRLPHPRTSKVGHRRPKKTP